MLSFEVEKEVQSPKCINKYLIPQERTDDQAV